MRITNVETANEFLAAWSTVSVERQLRAIETAIDGFQSNVLMTTINGQPLAAAAYAEIIATLDARRVALVNS